MAVSRVVAALCALVASTAVGADAATGPEPPWAARQPQWPPIDRGFVILDGQYLPPPYTLQRRDGELLINEHAIPSESFGDRHWGEGPPGRPGWGRGFHPGPRRRPWDPTTRALMNFRRRLAENGMLIAASDAKTQAVSEGTAASILATLLSDEDVQTKTRLLQEEYITSISPEQWEQITGTFQPTAELAERAEPIIERYRALREEHEAARERAEWSALVVSGPMRYGFTVVAMMLAVVATGSLLIHRPATEGRWSEVNSAGDSTRMVVRNVVLLALLGGFDLLFTLAAQQAGGFVELNPLATGLIGSPILLTAFKGIVFAIACAMLVALRNYRGAQIASWWLCLVCTIVTVRWLVYDSLFLG